MPHGTIPSPAAVIDGRLKQRGFADNDIALLANFDWPRDLTSDGGSIFLADQQNNLVREIDVATARVTTFISTYSLTPLRSPRSADARLPPNRMPCLASRIRARVFSMPTVAGASTAIARDGGICTLWLQPSKSTPETRTIPCEIVASILVFILDQHLRCRR